LICVKINVAVRLVRGSVEGPVTILTVGVVRGVTLTCWVSSVVVRVTDTEGVLVKEAVDVPVSVKKPVER
jgi:hypothetical protein